MPCKSRGKDCKELWNLFYVSRILKSIHFISVSEELGNWTYKIKEHLIEVSFKINFQLKNNV